MIELLLILVIILAILGGVAQVSFRILSVRTLFCTTHRFRLAIAEQQKLLTRAAELSHDPALQNAFLRALQQATDAACTLNRSQYVQAQQQLLLVLQQLEKSQRHVGRWSNGAYFENGDVIIPGGPSLVNGNLHMPH
jgi:hypothetical protein